MKKLKPVVLSVQERGELNRLITGNTIPEKKKYRYLIIRMLSDNKSAFKIAELLDITRPTVHLWQKRFLVSGFDGLKNDAPRSGRPRKIPEEKRKAIIKEVMRKQKSLPAWNYHSLAKSYGVSEATIRRLLK